MAASTSPRARRTRRPVASTYSFPELSAQAGRRPGAARRGRHLYGSAQPEPPGAKNVTDDQRRRQRSANGTFTVSPTRQTRPAGRSPRTAAAATPTTRRHDRDLDDATSPTPARASPSHPRHPRERTLAATRAARSPAATRHVHGRQRRRPLATGCYRYTLTGTDNVGNQSTVQSTIVKVDTSRAHDTEPCPLTISLRTRHYSGRARPLHPPVRRRAVRRHRDVDRPDTGIASYTFPNEPPRLDLDDPAVWTPPAPTAIRAAASEAGQQQRALDPTTPARTRPTRASTRYR